MKHVIWVLWPAFIAAGIAETIFFTMIDPAQLYLFGELVEWSATATYSTGFPALLAGLHLLQPDDLLR
ncbi:MAG: hypothetical protein V5B38_18630 [Candidatus Accumulibacter propinquus]|jgi:hypothetical protein